MPISLLRIHALTDLQKSETRALKARIRQYLFGGALLFAFALGLVTYVLEVDYGSAGRRELAGTGTNQCPEPFYMAFVYIAIVLYTFVGIGVVCDDYFEPTLSTISEKLGLSGRCGR